MCLCWCSSSLHRYLSSLGTLSWEFPMWFELLPLHAAYTLMHLDVLFVFVWASFWASVCAFPDRIWSIPCQKKPKHTRSLVEVLHHYIGIWAHFELCLGLSPMWFELLPLHTTYTLMHLNVLYVFVWDHVELDFELSPQEFELSHTQQDIHKHMCTLVGVLHHYIGIWAHFELCLGLSPMWFELLPLHTTYTLMHLDVLYVFVWAHFELDFEVSPLEFELFHAEKNIHKHMCTFVGVLHHYIGIWAHFKLCLELFPMWFELLPLHTTYTLMHLDVLNVVVWALFELSPLEFELRVAWLKFFITTSIFELILSSVLCFFQCDLSCYLYILHIPWCPTRVRWSPFWAWLWVFPQWNLSYPMHKKTYTTKKH